MYQTECRAVLFFVLDVNFQARSYIESSVKRFSFIWKKVEALTETSWSHNLKTVNDKSQTYNVISVVQVVGLQYLNV